MNGPTLSALIAFPLAAPSAFAQSTPQAEAAMGKANCAAPERRVHIAEVEYL
jgi:hypothetical protein